MAQTLKPPPRDFRHISQYKKGHTVDQMAQTIENGMAEGRSSMPPYPHIPQPDRVLIARFIQSLQEQP